jgi:hypothetical protein
LHFLSNGLALEFLRFQDGRAREGTMIPAGYMYKKIVQRPDWLAPADVDDIYSVSGCISKEFADYTDYWKHNGYWLLNSPAVMEEIARANNLALTGMTLFYYEVFEEQFDEESREWSPFEPEASFPTKVEEPASARLEGYDVATFYAGTSPECSPLSCNLLAQTVPVNRHCLFDSFEQAKQSLEAGQFRNSEPGPFRIFAVYSLA